MTNVLETRYRRLLRVLPADYRAAWEDEMVATYLESLSTDDEEAADYLAEFGRPAWSEVASVVGLAVRLRLPLLRHHVGGVEAAPRQRAVGDAVRIVALLGLLTQAAMAVVAVAMQLWIAGRMPGVSAPTGAWVGAHSGPWPTFLIVLGFAAVPAYLALVTGRWSAARMLAALSVGAAVALAGTDVVAGDPIMLTRVLALLVDGLLLAALWAFHGTAPGVHRRPWLLALPASVAVVAGLVAVTGLVGPALWLLDWPALACVTVAGGLAASLVRPAHGAAWPVALTALAATALAQRLLTLAEFASHATPNQYDAVIVAGVVEAAAVAAVGLPVAVRARRELRRLPAADPPAATALATKG
jgi:hypothetical protein